MKTDNEYVQLDEAKRARNKNNTEIDVSARVAAFDAAYRSNHETFIRVATDCEDFTFGDQWNEADRIEMKENRRPALTINMVLRAVTAVYGEYSSMKASITTKSRGRKAHDSSVMLNKVINQVLHDTGYSDHESDVFVDGAISGRGFFEVRLSDDEDPSGAVSISSLDNLQVVMHPDSKSYDPDSWPAVYTIEFLDQAEITRLYGEDKADSVTYSARGTGGLAEEELMESGHTFGAENPESADDTTATAKVITEQVWEYRKAFIFIDPNNSESETVFADEMGEDEALTLAEENGLVLEEKQVRHPRFYVYTSNDTLLFESWSPYRHINVIPYFFYFRKGRAMGMVENLRSPQEQINKGESQELHIVNSSSNGGWQMEEGALVNMSSSDLERSGAKPGIVVVRRRGSQPLEKIYPNSIPTGISNLGTKATNALIGVSGVNEGMLGQTPQNISGKVVAHKKQAGQSQLQMPFDNLERTRKLVGRIVVSIIQDYFTEARVLRYTAADAPETEELMINQANAAGRIVNDMSLGKYDIVVTTRPRQDVFTDYEFAELMALQGAGVAIAPWHLVEKSHVANRYEIAEEMRTAAGLNPTQEQIEMQVLDQQIAVETKKQSLLKLRAETEKLVAETSLVMAEANDVAEGQNRRFLLGMQADMHADERAGELRTILASRSSDTQITKQILSSKAKESQAILEAQLGRGMDDAKEEKPATPTTHTQTEEKE